MFAWHNNALHPIDATYLTRGWLYGDGCFTTLRVAQGKPWFAAEHINRLQRTAAFLGMACPLMLSALHTIVGMLDEAMILRLTLVRGGDTQLLTMADAPTHALITTRSVPVLKPLRVTTLTQPTPPWVEEPFYFKHLHYTPSIRALRHADAHGYDDALWLNQHGEAMTFSTGCLGWMVGEDVFISTYSAPSIGLEALRQIIPLRVAKTTLATLRAANAVFRINSTHGLVPLACLDTHAYSNDYAAFLTLSARWLTLAHNS